MNIVLFMVFFFSIFQPGARADENSPGNNHQANTLKIKKDHQDIEIRAPGDQFFESYYDDKAYQYHQSAMHEEGSSFFDTIWYWLVRMLNKTRGVFNLSPVIFNILLVIISIVFLYFLVTKTRVYNLFYSRDRAGKIPVYELNDEPEEADLDALFKEEYSKNNFRNAIRLLYLKLLNILDSQHLIIYSKDKTNQDYLKELNPGKIRDEYRNAVRIYEYVWYGQFFIDKKDCDRFIQNYEHLFRMVNG